MEHIYEQSPDKKKVKYSNVVDESDVDLVDPKDARILYLERQVYLLQRIVDEQKAYISERESLTSSSLLPLGQPSNNAITPSFRHLPNIVVEEILKHIPEQRTLVECRLISSQWNQLIEDTSELMKKITVPILHPTLFMNLDIVKKKKVKSIKFVNTSELNQSCFNNEFIDFISETIEKVEFEFENPDMPDQCELFEIILEKCGNLEELIINCQTVQTDDSADKIFQSTSLSTINIAAANILSVISINVDNYEEEDAAGLSIFLLKLPNLQEIQINGYCSSSADMAIITGLCEYLKNYDTKLRLKKLTLRLEGFYGEIEDWELLILLLILCEKYSIVIEKSPCVNINALLGFTGSTILPLSMLQQRPLFTHKIDGKFRFDGINSTVNFERLQFLGIEDVYLYFRSSLVKPEELGWIKEIPGLKSVYVEVSKIEMLLPSSNAALRDVFSTGLFSLEKLELKNEVLGPLDGFPSLPTFQKLKKLVIDTYKEVPNDLISQLTVLESLTKLKLDSLENLTDEVFTIECVNRFAEDNSSGILLTEPAIACFKQLKVLKILNCNKLTEVCLSEGIGKCKSLEKLVIKNCVNLKENYSKLVKCKISVWSFKDGRWIDHNSEPQLTIPNAVKTFSIRF